MTKILVFDTQRSIRNSLGELLEHEGFEVKLVGDVDGVVAEADAFRPDLILCGEPEGFSSPLDGVPWIALSAATSVESVIGCMRHRAVDFIPKPVNVARLLMAVRGALTAEQQERPSSPRYTSTRKKSCQSFEMIGSSEKMCRLRTMISRIAPSNARVLILGENGTGKELVARQIHQQSTRCNGPFVEVNCAAIPSELIESELFGHEKGAFTSAVRQRKGKFEQAIGGTLFLDEIGDMSLAAQAKVLRALQEKKICRVGSDKDIDVDVRVVAATNKDLESEIAKGNFREDLYHRLGVVVLEVPPVSQRVEDIPQLVEYFLDEICNEYSLPTKTIDEDAMTELVDMRWSGNVRQLHNVVERLVVLGGEHISCSDVINYAHH